MNLIQRLSNIWKWSGLKAPDGYDFYTSPKGKILTRNLSAEEKPRMAKIIHLRDEKKIIKDLIEDK